MKTGRWLCACYRKRETHGGAGADAAAAKPAVMSQVLGAVPVREPARRGPGPAAARARSAPPASPWRGARRVCVTDEKTVAEELSDLPGATWSCFMTFRSAASIPGAGPEAPPGQASRPTARGFFVRVWTKERRLQPGPHLISGPERGVGPGPVTRRGPGTEPGRSNDPMRLPRQSHQSPELSPGLISFLSATCCPRLLTHVPARPDLCSRPRRALGAGRPPAHVGLAEPGAAEEQRARPGSAPSGCFWHWAARSGHENRHMEFAGSTRGASCGHTGSSPWQTISQASWLPGHRRHRPAPWALRVGVRQDPGPTHLLPGAPPAPVMTATDVPMSPVSPGAGLPWARP